MTGGLESHKLLAIAARGRARRVQLGLQGAEVAARMNIGRHRYYNLECYGAGMLVTIERWAAALEMDPRELAFGPATPPAGLYPASLWQEQHPWPSARLVAERIAAIRAAIARRCGQAEADEWLAELELLQSPNFKQAISLMNERQKEI